MTVFQNIAYGLRIRKLPAVEIAERVREVVELIRLEGFEQRSVTHLSGGQAQRVALARALILRPQVLLLDEPLAALDLQLRRAMQDELRRIHQAIGGTFVFVTHDQEEAMRLANRIAVMKDGCLIQEGTAQEIYAHPKTRFVSTFIGDANVFKGRRISGTVELESGLRFVSPGADGPIVCVVRPDCIDLAPLSTDHPRCSSLALDGEIADFIFLGAYATYKVSTAGQTVTVQWPNNAPGRVLSIGDRVTLSWSPEHQVLLTDE